jgi:hypothetical protein
MGISLLFEAGNNLTAEPAAMKSPESSGVDRAIRLWDGDATPVQTDPSRNTQILKPGLPGS